MLLQIKRFWEVVKLGCISVITAVKMKIKMTHNQQVACPRRLAKSSRNALICDDGGQ